MPHLRHTSLASLSPFPLPPPPTSVRSFRPRSLRLSPTPWSGCTLAAPSAWRGSSPRSSAPTSRPPPCAWPSARPALPIAWPTCRAA
eukprot:341636-Chlamydomonas_euryale.AAC.1